ncbi:MAG: protein kinase [Phycisphaerae bacterium]|nr:protein kinase [Phycisphaerae bacterium]
MPIITICPKCGKQSKVSSKYAGRSGRCKTCNAKFTISEGKGQLIEPGDKPAPSPEEAVVDRQDAAAAASSDEEKVAAEWHVGDVILDLYEVKDLLGEGGMGKVHRVRHRGWNLDLAVKSPRRQALRKQAQKENFVRECETWINLGLHPNTVSCFYVRTLGGIPRVFAELVEGGCLKDWIDTKKLYEGGPDGALRRMLDVAIQFAWGLHYAHEKGLIHQDVKPANVMMTLEGVPRVTDFGLARARAVTGETGDDGSHQSILVSSGGRTPAYCSPEQANKEPLSRKTDIWSWGVSVLEMFTGEVTWMAGQAAAEALQSYLDTGVEDTSILKMPEPLAELLTRCFRRSPDDRPKDMQEVGANLKEIYRQTTGRSYERHEPEAVEALADSLNNRAISLLDLGKQAEAEELFQRALRADPHHPEATYNQGLTRWRAGAITDIELVRQLEEMRTSQEDNWLDEYLLSQVHLERGDAESAVKVLEDADGEVPEVAELLGKAKQLLPASRRCVRTFKGHTGSVSCACFSSDGRWALLGSPGDTAELWEVSSGRHVRTFEGSMDFATSACLSSDGRWALVSSAYDTIGLHTEEDEEYQEIRLWEVSSGRCVRTFVGHRGMVTSAGLSSGDRWVLSGGRDMTVRLWEVSTGRCIQTLEGHANGVSSVCLSSDGRLALSGSWDKTLRLWETSSGHCVRTFEGHREWVRSVCLSLDGRWALSGSADRTLKLWEVSSGRCVRTFEGHQSDVTSVCLGSGNRLALSGGNDRTLRLWDVSSGRCLRTFDGHTDNVNAVSVSSDGRRVLSGSADKTLKLWNVQGSGSSFAAQLHVARPTTSEVASAVSTQYRSLIDDTEKAYQRSDFLSAPRSLRQARALPGCSRRADAVDRWMSLYRHLPKAGLQGGWEERSFEGHADWLSSVCLSSDGRWALSGSADQTLRLWEVSSGRCVRTFEGYGDRVNSVCLSSDNRWALSGSWYSVLRLWEVSSGRCVRTFEGHEAWVSSVCLSSDGRWSLSGSADDTLKLWEVSSGRCVRTFEGHTDDVNSVCLSSDGRWALSGGGFRDRAVRLWEVSSGRCVRTFEGHADQVTSVCLSLDGRWALSGSGHTGGEDRTLRLWEISSGRCVRTFEGHREWVSSVCLSTDGHWALSGSADNTLKLWEVSSGRCIRTFEGHGKWVRSVCLSSGGRWALSGSDDNTLKLWALDWELEEKEISDWDNGAEPYLKTFLTQHMSYAGTLPTDDEPSEEQIALALTPKGAPQWTDDDFQRLLLTLGCAGYGWLRPEGVRRKLEEMTANWQGPLPLPEQI